ncbi:MAG: potassium channel protein [Planctomycetota bacterium]|nr:potassium channel protein [Planctomycetota bacterium]
MTRIAHIATVLALLPIIGMLGFHWIEGWGYFDSLYMSVITLSTVGFSELEPLSRAGRAFVIVYLVVGMGVFFYGIVQIGELIVRAELSHWDWLGRRRMDMTLKSLEGHYIVCGAGRMGQSVCRHLHHEKLRFVVIDRDEMAVAACREEGWVAIHSDATDDRNLIEAGVERARGLATVLPSDADNLYVVLSAKLLAPQLQIISRATDEISAAKLEKAGANRVVSLYHTGGIKMAHLLLKPDLEDFFEIFGGDLDLAEIHVADDDSISGKRLNETDFSRMGVVIVGIRRAGGELILPPTGSTEIQVDDNLIALGKSDAIARMIGT